MKIIAADDEPFALEDIISIIREVQPEAELQAFTDPEELLAYIKENDCDVAFLDIEMGYISGIDVAKQMKIINPKINIIFVTGYSEYAQMAINLRVSGYLMKPATKEAVEEELNNLRNPVVEEKKNRLVAKCFGNFDVFVNGQSLSFERNKTKELLAWLIDRRGSAVTSGELRAILWENATNDSATGTYLQKLKKDLITTLKKAGVESVFYTSWNKYAVNTDLISCDYYDYLDGKPEGVRAYNGEYMAQYSWGEIKNVLLQDRRKEKNL